MDICLNFMERWMKQAGKLHRADMRHLDDHGDIHLPEGFEVFTVRPANIFPSVCPCSPLCSLPKAPTPTSLPYLHASRIEPTQLQTGRQPSKDGGGWEICRKLWCG